jgi:hypothetical protein
VLLLDDISIAFDCHPIVCNCPSMYCVSVYV